MRAGRKAIAESARDTSEFAAWFRERVKEINGIDLDPNGPLPDVPEVTLDWKA